MSVNVEGQTEKFVAARVKAFDEYSAEDAEE